MKTALPFRRLKTVFLVMAAVGLTGCGSATLAGSSDAGPTVPYRPNFIVGADISAVPAAEARGIKFSDNGAQKDILQILKDHGFNYIRLRIFVEPTNQGGYSRLGYCGLAQTIPMAKRVKDAGMGLLLDFHYSDTWADPGKQTKPLAWRELPPEQLVKTLHDYTKDVITQSGTPEANRTWCKSAMKSLPACSSTPCPAGAAAARKPSPPSRREARKIGVSSLHCSRPASPRPRKWTPGFSS